MTQIDKKPNGLPAQAPDDNWSSEWTNTPAVNLVHAEKQKELELNRENYSAVWTSSSEKNMNYDHQVELYRVQGLIAASPKRQKQASPPQPLPKKVIVEESTGFFDSFFSKISDSLAGYYDWALSWFSSSDSKVEEGKGISDAARAELKKTIAMMNALLDQIKEIQETDLDDIKLEEHHLLAILAKKEESSLHAQRMNEVRKGKQALERERFRKMAETIELAKQGKNGSKFLEFASAFQLFATGVGLASGTYAVVISVVAVGMAVDSLLDDPVKKALAGLVSGDEASLNKNVDRIKLALGIASVAVSLGSALGAFGGARAAGNSLPNAVLNFIQATAALLTAAGIANEEILKYRNNDLKATLLDFKYKIDHHQDKFKEALEGLRKLNDSSTDSFQQQNQLNRNRHETVTALIREIK